MNTQTLKTPWSRTSAVARGLTLATLAAGAWALSAMGSQAHARSDVHWSIGVNTPGVVVGVSNAPPVYYAPPPVYYAPPPVYYAPRPIYRSGWGPAPRWEGRRHGHHRHDRYDGYRR
jgi:hypothetical protein